MKGGGGWGNHFKLQIVSPQHDDGHVCGRRIVVSGSLHGMTKRIIVLTALFYF